MVWNLRYSHYVWVGIKCLLTIYECNTIISSEVFLAILFEKKIIRNLFKGLSFALTDKSSVVCYFINEFLTLAP